MLRAGPQRLHSGARTLCSLGDVGGGNGRVQVKQQTLLSALEAMGFTRDNQRHRGGRGFRGIKGPLVNPNSQGARSEATREGCALLFRRDWWRLQILSPFFSIPRTRQRRNNKLTAQQYRLSYS
jgi:hypothetical protein